MTSAHFDPSFGGLLRQHSALFVLFAATGLASVLACGSDNKTDKSTADTETVVAPLLAQPGGDTPNGLSIPKGVADWGVVGVAARPDSGTLHVVVGNETAVTAARAGETNPWPEGTMLSHLVWNAQQNPDDPSTIGPGDFNALTLMVKNSTKYAADGGWAYGVWSGSNLVSPDTADFDRACVNCHTATVADNDFVFTVPGALPDADTIAAAAPGGNGVAFPSKVLDWRVIGVADVVGTTPSIRVIVGNPTAVDAVRSGQTNPWPDGSMISHYNWAVGDNPASDSIDSGTVSPGSFNAFTLMQRSSALYPDDGNWAYGAWGSTALSPLPAGGDQACIDCHTAKEPMRDDVFSRVANVPPALYE
jgi:hypothetical protein